MNQNKLIKIIEEGNDELNNLGDIWKRDGQRIGDSGCPLFYRFNREIKHFHSQQIKKILEEVKKWAEDGKMQEELNTTVENRPKFPIIELYNKPLKNLQDYLDEAIKELK